jgi:aspartyl-tRNA(Asn)/glutamyl-tRNA(Gln) amidotransferase subunit A
MVEQWAGRDAKMARQFPPVPISRGNPMARNTARERLEAALARIDDPKGEGARACLTVYREQAKAAADAADARAKSGISLGPLDGTIVSL